MKILVIGGNRFVGLRLVHQLEALKDLELHVVNRTGQVAHSRHAIVHKSDRNSLALSQLDRDWDVVYDFACFNRREAEAALSYFGKVGNYIFISTVSVYDPGAALTEAAFNAATWNLDTPLATGASVGLSYQHGKRQAESVFASSASCPVVSVRFPVILGPDDYTRRLEFHLERAESGEVIYAANPNARFSLIHAGDAADFLLWAHNRNLSGPLNVASAQPLALRDLCAQIELITGHRANIQPPPPHVTEGVSTYSPSADLFMDVGKMQALGFKTRATSEWLPQLIGQPALQDRKGFVH